MATIYKPPKGFNPPEFSLNRSAKEELKLEDAYVTAIQRWARENYRAQCPEAGELISFPVADGKALYVVATLKPVQLIHVDVGDAYNFQYANRLTAADIREEIRSAKALTNLFKKAKAA